ncbi:receptor-like protein EIX2 [Cryptomeria japonica]|uniref:receptor-like protein EIX2 n=1 Tax=Cryptomeria japonica TaxID=3369 RepID=UPI0027DA98AF|nr:receptor-like protein EIX2 [Cryptomeria japonica]
MSPISVMLNLTFALSMICPFINGCPADERNYLLDFKGGLLDPTGRLSSWQGYNCCEWKGVRCDFHSGHVISLHLKNPVTSYWDKPKNLSGAIHPSLFNLQYLQHLDLGNNDFDGASISPEFSKLQSLTFLSLASAGFGGEVPVELGNITTLRQLDLSADSRTYYFTTLQSRKFAGLIQNLRSLEYLAMNNVDMSMTNDHWRNALSSLPNLREIYLSWCNLEGTIPSLLNLTYLSDLDLSMNSFFSPLPAWFQNVSSLVSLDLSDNGVNGSIPSNFLHRSSLRNLDLSFNDLEGSLSFIQYQSSSIANLNLHRNWLDGIIPLFFVDFTELKNLVLANNYLTGDLPPLGSALGEVLPLSVIDLSLNKLTGNIPPSIGCLPLLRSLNLENNQLSGKIPDTLFKLARLEKLKLSTNNLTGIFSLSMMDNFTELRQLGLSNNSFTVSISSSWIPPFPHLRYLGMRSCNVEGDFPAFLSTQYSLVDLDLSDNKIVGAIPTWLWDLPVLEVVTLSNNQLQGFLPSVISKKFERVDLKRNKLQGSLPFFKNCMYFFDGSKNNFTGSLPATMYAGYTLLSGNNLTGEIPSSFCSVHTELVPLSAIYLDLSKNNLKGTIPPNLWGCNQLVVLNLAENDLQGEIPEQMGKMRSLDTLNLYGNNLHGTIPSSIVNCGHLRVFDLGSNQIQGKIPVLFSELQRLRILNLASNQFEGTIPALLLELEFLQILDLSHNCLSGPITKNLGKLYAMANESPNDESEFARPVVEDDVFHDYYSLIPDQVTLWVKGRALAYEKIFKKFRFMDLSNNKLSGNIPPEVGLLKNLNALNFSRNNLSGPIPKSVGGLVQLESLDLSANKLSGRIPSELLNLTFLEVLNVSDNMLSGLIPQGKQFATFDASSFSGNPDLHGPPLENRTLSHGFGGNGSPGSQEESNNEASNK